MPELDRLQWILGGSNASDLLGKEADTSVPRTAPEIESPDDKEPALDSERVFVQKPRTTQDGNQVCGQSRRLLDEIAGPIMCFAGD